MRRVVDQTGLAERLRQHSRHSGMMIGLSMALVIMLAVSAFIWIFFRIDPWLSDVTGQTGASRASPFVRIATPSRTAGTPGRPAQSPEAPQASTPAPVQPPTPTALAIASPAATPGFAATHQVADFGERVNLRSGPTASSARIALLTPGTKLKFLNVQEQVGDVVWLKFETERGDVGWIRGIDVLPIR